ncbi:MAG TPA: hypothetical protein VNZ86_09545 [Bacteroidia bacterium]|jgi:hypothetical protein|nr:hypothetical protein [Bacteroidia bacterium]
MKKIILSFSAVLLLSGAAFAQLEDEKNVTITMDLQPILQLNMNTSDQINFSFDDIADYYGGITKYGATILTVSSTVSWDLYAVGSSNAGVVWDNQMVYGAGTDPNAIRLLPIEALELHQSIADATPSTGTYPDYSTAFAPASAVAIGQNSIYASATPYVAPAITDKYIQGQAGAANFAAGGSYLTQGALLSSIYYYAIDYRILPGLPAVFPAAGDNAAAYKGLAVGKYAQPGVYTMNVKYVLLENQ